MSAGDEVTASDIAQARGWSRTTAWRWLRQLEAKHGSQVVSRRGRKLFTTHAALAQVAASIPDPRIMSEVQKLQRRVTEAEKRADGLARDFLEFRRKANEWFRKHPAT